MAEKNPFAPLFDFQKAFTDFQFPGMDMKAWTEAYEHNIEALNQANQAVARGMQEVAEKQAQLLQEAVAQAQDAYAKALESDGPREKAAKQVEITRKAFEKALKDIRDMAEIVSKSNTEAVNVINHRVSESLEEIREMISDQSSTQSESRKPAAKRT